MIKDQHIISALLTDTEEDAIKFYSLKRSGYEFSQNWFEWIESHFEKYNRLPNLLTFQEHFKFFEKAETPEPWIYYVREAEEIQKKRFIDRKLATIPAISSSEEQLQAIFNFKNAFLQKFDNREEVSIQDHITNDIFLYKNRRDRQIKGIPFIFEELFQNSSNILPGESAFIVAPFKNYKTFVLMMQIVKMATTNNEMVTNGYDDILVYTYELTPEAFRNRIYCIAAKIDWRKYCNNEVTDEELERMYRIVNGEDVIYDFYIKGAKETITIPGLKRKITILQGKEDIASIELDLHRYKPVLLCLDAPYAGASAVNHSAFADVVHKLVRVVKGNPNDKDPLRVPCIVTWQKNREGSVGGTVVVEQQADYVITYSREQDTTQKTESGNPVLTNVLNVSLSSARNVADQRTTKYVFSWEKMDVVSSTDPMFDRYVDTL